MINFLIALFASFALFRGSVQAQRTGFEALKSPPKEILVGETTAALYGRWSLVAGPNTFLPLVNTTYVVCNKLTRRCVESLAFVDTIISTRRPDPELGVTIIDGYQIVEWSATLIRAVNREPTGLEFEIRILPSRKIAERTVTGDQRVKLPDLRGTWRWTLQ
ncbi:MAG: hypothetical protein A3J28_11965 [Acidobacteria bacterium RIFCSPLOWO2_12_FULL_60_22]|nr:MAG: hypothetical protein A3J28_11965 [Acidobacteria bacterium RIFCSPLOWO2_12_FULL_60_22]